MREFSCLSYPCFCNTMTADYNTKIGPEACKSVYLWLPPKAFESFADGNCDDAHLQYNGAFAYAGLVFGELKRLGVI